MSAPVCGSERLMWGSSSTALYHLFCVSVSLAESGVFQILCGCWALNAVHVYTIGPL